MTAAAPSPQPQVQPSDPLWRKALDNPWLMLVMLFFVTAALGLPFLWMSRGFSLLSKIVLTIAVLAWTVLILLLFWLVMAWTLPTIFNGLHQLFFT